MAQWSHQSIAKSLSWTGRSASQVGRILADLDLKPLHPAQGSLTRAGSTRCCASTPKPAWAQWSQIDFLPRWSHFLLPQRSPKDPDGTSPAARACTVIRRVRVRRRP